MIRNMQATCQSYNDSILMWPETKANSTAFQRCPYSEYFEEGRAFRHCHTSGRWTDNASHPVDDIRQSFTNFSECIPTNLKELLKSDKLEITIFIANNLSYLAIGGLILSTFTLFLSVFILSKYRYLMNYRTKIHKQLFIALLFETAIQLSIHIELIKKEQLNVISDNHTANVENVLLNLRCSIYEYFITAVFLWMLVEGVHIHNIIAVNVFHTRYWFNCYLFMGWVIPIPNTLIWTICMIVKFSITKKWEFPHLQKLYWIMASLRLFCIVINIVFLINVIRVLVLKLRANNSSDICQAKTAIKAAVLLIPLLGVVNFVQMLEAKMGTNEYYVLQTLQALLPSYQGLFVSIIFCLINKDVRLALARSYNKYRTRTTVNSDLRMKSTNWDSRHRLQSNLNTITSTLLSNTETKTNLDD